MDIGVEYIHKKGELDIEYEIGSKKESVIPFIPKGSGRLKLKQIKKILGYFKNNQIHGWRVFIDGTELVLEKEDCEVRYNKIVTTEIQIPSIYHSGRTEIHINLLNNIVYAHSALGHPHISGENTCLGNTIKTNLRFDALLPIKMISWAETYVGTNPYTYIKSVYCMDSRDFKTPKTREATMYFLDDKGNFFDIFEDVGLFVQHKFIESTLTSRIPYLALKVLDKPFTGEFEYLNDEILEAIKKASYIYFMGTDSALVFDISKMNDLSQMDQAIIVSGSGVATDSVAFVMSMNMRTLRDRTSETVNIPGVYL